MATVQTLHAAETTNTSSSAFGWNGGRGSFTVYGTFGGATVTLQASPDTGTTWLTVGSATTLTAAGIGNFDLPSGFQIRSTITGGSAASISAKLIGP